MNGAFGAFATMPVAYGFASSPDDRHLRTRGSPSRLSKGSPVANIKSQIKRIRTNELDRQRNKAVKSGLKTSIRKFQKAADAGSPDAAELAREASRALDKAASKGVIHANQAANRKSAIATRASAL